MLPYEIAGDAALSSSLSAGFGVVTGLLDIASGQGYATRLRFQEILAVPFDR